MRPWSLGLHHRGIDSLDDAIAINGLPGTGAAPNIHPCEIRVDALASLAKPMGKPIRDGPKLENLALARFDFVCLAKLLNIRIAPGLWISCRALMRIHMTPDAFQPRPARLNRGLLEIIYRRAKLKSLLN